MKKIYILYRPVLDYEESESSYLACKTLEQAQTVRAEIISECNKIASQLIYEWGEISDDEYVEFHMRNQEVLGSAKWPYGLKQLKYDLQKHSEYNYYQEKFVESYVFNERAISIMELPIV
jgi:hypothetical protein